MYTAARTSEIFAKYFGDTRGERFVLTNTTRTKQGTVIERYQEYLGNYKVEGGTYALMYDKSGNATFMNGNAYHSDAVVS
ncbi:hypothetical protein, partial [Mycobacterium tuberculosis]